MRVIAIVVFSSLFVSFVKTMEDPFKNLELKEKFTKLLLQPSVQHPDGTVWDFDKIKREDTFFSRYIQKNNYKDLSSVGLVMLEPQSLLLVLLATFKQKNDSCVLVQMTSWPLFTGDIAKLFPQARATLFLHGSFASHNKITRLKIARDQNSQHLAVTLYAKEERDIGKDLILVENSAANFMKIVGQKTLKTWELKK